MTYNSAGTENTTKYAELAIEEDVRDLPVMFSRDSGFISTLSLIVT